MLALNAVMTRPTSQEPSSTTPAYPSRSASVASCPARVDAAADDVAALRSREPSGEGSVPSSTCSTWCQNKKWGCHRHRATGPRPVAALARSSRIPFPHGLVVPAGRQEPHAGGRGLDRRPAGDLVPGCAWWC